ncbi:MAG: hypothetical protein GC159_02815 [Phycisphaera sp.]|nr:hypothetical protein [Phycisphaera sp.]
MIATPMSTPAATLSRPPIARRARLLIVPAAIVMMCTLPHLDQGDYRKDTGRYAAVGLQLWEGGSFLSPALHPDNPYFNKPPLALWIHGLFLHVFGTSVAVARIPSILAAIGVTCLTIATTRRVATRAEAMAVGVVLATTVEFFRRTREISLDMWQLLFLMFGCWCVVTAIKRERPALIVAAGVGVGLALLCKPLVGLLGIVIWGVWLWQCGRARWIGWLAGALAVAIAVAAPWHVYMASVHGEAFTARYFGYEVLDRAMGWRSTNGPLYYFIELGRSYWPWLAAVAWGVWLMIRRTPHPQVGERPGEGDGSTNAASHGETGNASDGSTLTPTLSLKGRGSRAARLRAATPVALGLSWTLIWLVVLIAFPDKKTNYALVLYPGLSMIAGWALLRVPASLKAMRLPRLWLREGCPHVLKIAAPAAVVIAVLPLKFQDPPDKQMQALMQWMRDEHVEPGQTYSRLGNNGDGQFYLRMGAWPMPAAWIPEGRGDASLLIAVNRSGKGRRDATDDDDSDDATPRAGAGDPLDAYTGEAVYENPRYVVYRVNRNP